MYPHFKSQLKSVIYASTPGVCSALYGQDYIHVR